MSHEPATVAVIYARISSVAQLQKGHGLASQETRCREYARMKGYSVAEVFHDEAVSGGVIDRPGISAMLEYLTSRKTTANHVVIIDDISRIARDIKTHLELRDAISSAGAKLESPSIEFGEDSDSILVENLLASVSQHQRQKNAEQTKNRMRARMMNGYWPFHACMGFKYETVPGRGKMLRRDEPLASIIEEGLRGYALGRFQLQAEVKRFFESFPAFPRDRAGRVRNQKVKDILTHSLYAGYVESPEWGVSLRPGQHEGLIDLETFEKIQERIKEGAKAPIRANINMDFPLRGFVTCATCEHPLTACWSKSKTGKRHAYYMCFKKGCDSYRKSIRRDDLEGAFDDLLCKLKPSRMMFSVARVMFTNSWNQHKEQLSYFVKAAKRELITLEKQIEQFLDRIVTAPSASVVGAYETRLAKLERNKHLMVENIAKAGKPRRPFEEMFELAMNFLSNPCYLWRSERLADKQTVLKLVFCERLQYCRKLGFRTPQVSVPFALLGDSNLRNIMAEREGFEPSERLRAQRFSRPPRSTTPAPLREAAL
jgi:site-specific DNA recombinase